MTYLPSVPQVWNVRVYGARGDGVTDDTTALQNAVNAAYTAGGGTVFMPPGTYIVSPVLRSGGTTEVAAGIFLRSNVTLMGAGVAATTIKLISNYTPVGGLTGTKQVHIISTWNPYTATLADTQSNIAAQDFTLDGNAANQSFALPTYFSDGFFIGATRGFWCSRVVAKNVYGLGSGPSTGEAFSFDFNTSVDGHYTDCEAIATTTNTSTGFSANASTSCEWTGCTARGFTYGQGFTAGTCSLLRYTNCHAYLVAGQIGFNLEGSTYVSYTGCHGGGLAAPYASSAFYTNAQSLGNDEGFRCLGCQYVTYTGCHAAYNTTGNGYGYEFRDLSGTNCDHITIVGGDIRGNTVGIYVNDLNQTNICVEALFSGNTTDIGGAGSLGVTDWSQPNLTRTFLLMGA